MTNYFKILGILSLILLSSAITAKLSQPNFAEIEIYKKIVESLLNIQQ